jgi:hypothetical protein
VEGVDLLGTCEGTKLAHRRLCSLDGGAVSSTITCEVHGGYVISITTHNVTCLLVDERIGPQKTAQRRFHDIPGEVSTDKLTVKSAQKNSPGVVNLHAL